jgi:predicted amidohydrolase YtcJ
MCVANSRALELAGVDASTPDPPGGRIAHDASGRPTGLLLETAEDLVLGRVSNTRENMMTALRRVSDDLLRRGITACCDAWLGYSEGVAEYDIWTEALETGVFRPSISFLVQHKLWQAASDEQRAATGLNVLGVKIVADGSISGGSAGLDDPFLGDGDDRLFVYEAEELSDICAAVRSEGLVIAIHAMGDGAISMALDAVERSRTIATERNPKMRGARERSHRIEHCSLPRRSDIQRMARRGVIPVIQPIFLFAEGDAYLAKLGKERSMWANPARAMIDAGVHVAMSSDAPATTWGEPTDVMLGIQTSVARRTWAGSSLGTGQATTAAEALVAYTWNAAHAAGFGKTLGSIAVGRRADMVVLSEDPTRVPTEAIGDVRIIATLLAGELVHGEL